MNNHSILNALYKKMHGPLAAFVLVCTWYLNWSAEGVVYAVLLSGGIVLPVLFWLQACLWLVKKYGLAPAFTWMLILAALPLLLIVPAYGLAPLLPGDGLPLLLIGLFLSYAGILGEAIRIQSLMQPRDSQT